MEKGYNVSKVMNGTWGQVWIDSHYLAELASINAKVTAKTESIPQCGQMIDGTKVTGLEPSGTLKLNKTSSYFLRLLGDDLKKGVLTQFTIITKVADPANGGTERVKLTGCTFTELTLVDIEQKKNMEESMPFTFSDYEILDYID